MFPRWVFTLHIIDLHTMEWELVRVNVIVDKIGNNWNPISCCWQPLLSWQCWYSCTKRINLLSAARWYWKYLMYPVRFGSLQLYSNKLSFHLKSQEMTLSLCGNTESASMYLDEIFSCYLSSSVYTSLYMVRTRWFPDHKYGRRSVDVLRLCPP